MLGRPPQSRRSGRSGLYSGSKFTHWTEYDPYESEISALPGGMLPAAHVATGGDGRCPVYERPLHPDFVRPFTPEDVCDTLASMPPEFLAGLKGVYLLGGTRKQLRVFGSDLFHYGCYGSRRIYLHPFPRRRMEFGFRRLPRPHVTHDYRRAGAVWEATASGWVCRFDRESLRRFYLHDVLVHEVGHHVDRGRDTTDETAERYAEWFARTYGDRARRRERDARRRGR